MLEIVETNADLYIVGDANADAATSLWSTQSSHTSNWAEGEHLTSATRAVSSNQRTAVMRRAMPPTKIREASVGGILVAREQNGTYTDDKEEPHWNPKQRCPRSTCSVSHNACTCKRTRAAQGSSTSARASMATLPCTHAAASRCWFVMHAITVRWLAGQHRGRTEPMERRALSSSALTPHAPPVTPRELRAAMRTDKEDVSQKLFACEGTGQNSVVGNVWVETLLCDEPAIVVLQHDVTVRTDCGTCSTVSTRCSGKPCKKPACWDSDMLANLAVLCTASNTCAVAQSAATMAVSSSDAGELALATCWLSGWVRRRKRNVMAAAHRPRGDGSVVSVVCGTPCLCKRSCCRRTVSLHVVAIRPHAVACTPNGIRSTSTRDHIHVCSRLQQSAKHAWHVRMRDAYPSGMPRHSSMYGALSQQGSASVTHARQTLRPQTRQ